jgi:hypothetical protein
MQVRVLSWWPILEGEPVRSAGAALNTDGAARHGLRVHPPSASLESEPGRARRPLEAGWARRRCGSGPPLSSTESQPDRRAGAASKTDGTERCEIRVLGSPPNSV